MTAADVLIHAGQHKTGSTSIQRALALSAAELASRGITVWDVAPNHSMPLQVALDDRCGPTTAPEPWRRFTGSGAEVWPHLADSLVASEQTFVITGEGLAKQGITRLAALRDFIHEVVPEAAVRLVVYVRRPDRHLHSYVQQGLKRGFTFRRSLSYVAVLDYRGQLGRLFEVFGREHVDVRLMPELDTTGPQRLLVDFAHVLGRPDVVWPRVDPQNPAMSQAAAELLDDMHEARPSHIEFGQRHRWVTMLVRKQVGGPPFRLPAEVVRQTLDRYAQDIAWLLDHTGIDLGGPYPDEPLDPGAHHPTPAEVGRLLSRILEVPSAQESRQPPTVIGRSTHRTMR